MPGGKLIPRAKSASTNVHSLPWMPMIRFPNIKFVVPSYVPLSKSNIQHPSQLTQLNKHLAVIFTAIPATLQAHRDLLRPVLHVPCRRVHEGPRQGAAHGAAVGDHHVRVQRVEPLGPQLWIAARDVLQQQKTISKIKPTKLKQQQ